MVNIKVILFYIMMVINLLIIIKLIIPMVDDFREETFSYELMKKNLRENQQNNQDFSALKTNLIKLKSIEEKINHHRGAYALFNQIHHFALAHFISLDKLENLSNGTLMINANSNFHNQLILIRFILTKNPEYTISSLIMDDDHLEVILHA